MQKIQQTLQKLFFILPQIRKDLLFCVYKLINYDSQDQHYNNIL